MKTSKIVSSLVDRASGGPAWVSEAVALVKRHGDSLLLVKSGADGPEDEDEESVMGAFALFSCTGLLLTAFGNHEGTDRAMLLELTPFLKKHALDMEFGVSKGKLCILLSTDSDRYEMKDMS